MREMRLRSKFTLHDMQDISLYGFSWAPKLRGNRQLHACSIGLLWSSLASPSSGFSSVSLIMWSCLFAWLWALHLLMWDWGTCRCHQCLCMTCLGTMLEIPPSGIMPFLRGKEVAEGGGGVWELASYSCVLYHFHK